MASGLGLKGGTSRCFPFVQAYMTCLKGASEEKLADCFDVRDDYFECLHHKKEYARIAAINAEKRRQASGAPLPSGGGGGGGGH